jgi:hypothetical protein
VCGGAEVWQEQGRCLWGCHRCGAGMWQVHTPKKPSVPLYMHLSHWALGCSPSSVLLPVTLGDHFAWSGKKEQFLGFISAHNLWTE